MNIPRYIHQVNPIQCYHRTNMTPPIMFLRTNERNIAYGCQLHEGRDCLTSSQNYMPLTRFIEIDLCQLSVLHVVNHHVIYTVEVEFCECHGHAGCLISNPSQKIHKSHAFLYSRFIAVIFSQRCIHYL